MHASAVPVVSAVGHETDYTICDFVADVRAPTPSAAAEIVFPQKSSLHSSLAQYAARAREALLRDLRRWRMHLRAVRAELGDPRSVLRERIQRLAHARMAQDEALRRLIMKRRLLLRNLETRLAHLHPRVHFSEGKQRVEAARKRILFIGSNRLASERRRLRSLEQRLLALSPLGVLDRGYAIVLSPAGQAVRDPSEVIPGDSLDIRVCRGSLTATVVAPQAIDPP